MQEGAKKCPKVLKHSNKKSVKGAKKFNKIPNSARKCQYVKQKRKEKKHKNGQKMKEKKTVKKKILKKDKKYHKRSWKHQKCQQQKNK